MPPRRPVRGPDVSADDLTIPNTGSTTARSILSAALIHLSQELPLIGRGLALSPAMQEDVRSFHVFRDELAKKHRGALQSFVARTSTATILRCLRSQPSEALISEFMGLVYFELARVGALEKPIRQNCPPRRLLSQMGQLVITMPDLPRAITYAPGKLVLEFPSNSVDLDLEIYDDKPAGYSEIVSGIRIEKPYHLIEKKIFLALADNNP